MFLAEAEVTLSPSQLINGFQPFSVTPWSFNICATLLLKQKLTSNAQWKRIHHSFSCIFQLHSRQSLLFSKAYFATSNLWEALDGAIKSVETKAR
jgi:hypothetical protein